MDAENSQKPQLQKANSQKTLELDFERVLQIIGTGGLFESTVPHFESRRLQCQMAANVVDAYNRNGIQLIEAGTGTGKSIAYILPAILWALKNQQRTLISTHTITLQEQLIHRDIPNILKALNVDIKAVLLKGMSNYLCLRKLEDVKHELLLLPPAEAEEIVQLECWGATTSDGSKMSLPKLPSASAWERVSAESDSCNNVKCPHYQRCFFFKARREAEEAQILVANHHLLFADLAVRLETSNYDNSAVIPVYSRVIIDEAHHIEDVATDFLGSQVSKLSIFRTLSRISSERHTKSSGKLPLLREKLVACVPAMSALLARIQLDIPGLKLDLMAHINALFDSLSAFVSLFPSSNALDKEEGWQGDNKLRLLPIHLTHAEWKAEIVPRAKKGIGSMQRYLQALASLEHDLKAVDHEKFQEQSKSLRLDITAFRERLSISCSLLEQFLLTPPPDGKVRWIEVHRLQTTVNVSLIDADLDISQAMVDFFLSKFSSIVFCSATMTTDRHFDFFRKRLGLIPELLPQKPIETHIYDSPFNYKRQAFFAIPTDLPPPHHPSFIDAAVEQVWRAIEISRGGAFLLFTSYGMMQKFYDLLAARLQAMRYTSFKQGDANRQTLLSQFRSSQRGILFGTDSFWEGVDIAGEALRCVIIVKLPFKVPTEPIVQARTEAIESQGGDPFFEYTLPTAIVKFKQGFGRLIRGKKDRGCVLCLDTRLATKKYGSLFLNTIPACQMSFAPSLTIEQQMREFYRKTHYLVVN